MCFIVAILNLHTVLQNCLARFGKIWTTLGWSARQAQIITFTTGRNCSIYYRARVTNLRWIFFSLKMLKLAVYCAVPRWYISLPQSTSLPPPLTYAQPMFHTRAMNVLLPSSLDYDLQSDQDLFKARSEGRLEVLLGDPSEVKQDTMIGFGWYIV